MVYCLANSLVLALRSRSIVYNYGLRYITLYNVNEYDICVMIMMDRHESRADGSRLLIAGEYHKGNQ